MWGAGRAATLGVPPALAHMGPSIDLAGLALLAGVGGALASLVLAAAVFLSLRHLLRVHFPRMFLVVWAYALLACAAAIGLLVAFDRAGLERSQAKVALVGALGAGCALAAPAFFSSRRGVTLSRPVLALVGVGTALGCLGLFVAVMLVFGFNP